MMKVSIEIAFLTILAQLQYGLGNGSDRYKVRSQTMPRIGTFPRPSLHSPSNTSFSTKSADLLEQGVLPSGQSDSVNKMNDPFQGSMSSAFRPNLNDFHGYFNELESELKKGKLGDRFKSDSPVSGARTAQPPRRGYSFSNESPKFSSDLLDEHKRAVEAMTKQAEGMLRQGGLGGLSFSTPKVQVPVSKPVSEPAQPPSKTDPFPSFRTSGGSSRYNVNPPPITPEPSDPPAAPSPFRRSFSFRIGAPQITPPTSTPSTTPTPTTASTPSATPLPSPPLSCPTGQEKPSIDRYRSRSSLSKSPSFKGGDYETPKAAEPSPSETPRRYGGSGSSLPTSNTGSLDTQRFGGSTVVSEKLPNNGGTIDIRISGKQIDDERISQMIKEAKNAITTVFYAPLYETSEMGQVVFSDKPPTHAF